MIIVKNRTLLFSNREQYLGTSYDESSSARLIMVPRISIDGVDIANLTFTMNAEKSNGTSVSSYLEKEIRDDDIILLWKIKNEVLNPAGTVFLSLHATDAKGTVKWSTYRAPAYSEGSADTPGYSGGQIVDLEQMIAKAEELQFQLETDEQSRAAAEEERQKAELERAASETLREQKTEEVIKTFEDAIASAEAHADKSVEYSEIARNEANRASMYANYVEPDFILQDNRVYINQNSTVEFCISENRLYFKLPG